MLHPQERILLRRAGAITLEVENVLKQDFSVPFFNPGEADQIRLLRLAQWRERHGVSLTWILKTLIPFWRSRHARYLKSAALGTSIATFTGMVSEAYLLEQIATQFPSGENQARRRVREQDRQFFKTWDGATSENWDDPDAMMEKYTKRVRIARRERHIFAEKMQERPYRGNPWMD